MRLGHGGETVGVIKAAVFDLEGTLTTGETWRGVGRFLKARGMGGAYDRFFALHLPGALLAKARVIPKRWYQNIWMKNLAGLLAGMDGEALSEMARWVVAHELWPHRREQVVAELLRLRDEGYRIVLASGTYQPVLEAFAERLGPGVEALGTALEMRGERATGRLGGPMNVDQVKAERVQSHLGGAPALAFGDTPADLPLLMLAEHAVVVGASPRLRREAEARGWRQVPG